MLINPEERQEEPLLPFPETTRTTNRLRCFHATVCIAVASLFMLTLFDTITGFVLCLRYLIP